jgi:microcystin-dependent protein
LTPTGINVIKQNSGGGTPTGTIIAYASNGSLPDGYLACDGSAVSRTTYADLFDAIGTDWGAGNGSTTFNLPNLNGYWAKGSSTAGSSISAGLPNITGTVYGVRMNTGNTAEPTGAFSRTDSSNANYIGSASGKTYVVSFSAKSSNSIYGSSTTVSVSSKTVRYMIKY